MIGRKNGFLVQSSETLFHSLDLLQRLASKKQSRIGSLSGISEHLRDFLGVECLFRPSRIDCIALRGWMRGREGERESPRQD